METSLEIATSCPFSIGFNFIVFLWTFSPFYLFISSLIYCRRCFAFNAFSFFYGILRVCLCIKVYSELDVNRCLSLCFPLCINQSARCFSVELNLSPEYLLIFKVDVAFCLLLPLCTFSVRVRSFNKCLHCTLKCSFLRTASCTMNF